MLSFTSTDRDKAAKWIRKRCAVRRGPPPQLLGNSTWLALPRGYLDFNLNSWVNQPSGYHRSGWANFSEVLSQSWPAGLEILSTRQDIASPHHIRKLGVRLAQRGGDVLHALFNLRNNVVRNSHRPIIKTCRTGHENPVASTTARE
jgi:hypothetical protein